MRVRVWAGAAAAVSAACSVAAAQPAPPQVGGGTGAGDVNLTPRRLVLSGRQRAGEVVVFNRGNGRAVYRVELEDLAMTPTGALESLDKVDASVRARHRSAKDLLRYSPRRIELAPGASQVVRVLARSSAEAAPGEARSHLVVTAVPTQGAGLDVAEAVAPGSRELRVRITPVFGISIPIIVRSGDSAAQASFTDARVSRAGGRSIFTAVLRRSGGRSIYGDVTVSFTPPGGRAVKVGELKGVAAYPEVDARPVTVTLEPPAGATLGAGTYRAVMRDAETADGPVLAQVEVSGG